VSPPREGYGIRPAQACGGVGSPQACCEDAALSRDGLCRAALILPKCARNKLTVKFTSSPPPVWDIRATFHAGKTGTPK